MPGRRVQGGSLLGKLINFEGKRKKKKVPGRRVQGRRFRGKLGILARWS